MDCSAVGGRAAISLALQGLVDPALEDRAALVLHAARTYAGVVDGFEIGFFTDQAQRHRAALERADVRAALGAFSANTLHFAARRGARPGWADLGPCIALAGELFEAGLVIHASLHLDMAELFAAARAAAPRGLPLLFENLDGDAARGASLEDCQAAAREHPRWGVVLDYAHALEAEARGGAGPEQFLRALGAAVGQVHFSWPGNLYPQALMGPGFSTRHSMIHLAPQAGERAARFLRQARPALVTIEGVVPPGPAGARMVRAEAAFIAANRVEDALEP